VPGILILKEPSACSESELAEFERLVRLGFEGSDDSLPARVRAANRLAFQFEPEAGAVAIAGLKQPRRKYTAEVFTKAGCDVAPDNWRLELGWVFVSPTHRGAGFGKALCEQLLRPVENQPVFATTRPDNSAMIRILESLGFERTGGPFPRRSRILVVYLRSGRDDPGPDPADSDQA
jgi:RimJ/RimL family protein N-acetyltransferase